MGSTPFRLCEVTVGILDRFSLNDRTALVTGGGQGIGEALAIALAEAGADVAILDLNADTAEETAESIRALGRRSLSVQADVTKPDEVADAVSTVVSEWGRLDIGVNNAGVAKAQPSVDVTEEDWDFIVDVDLKGVFLCAQAEGRVMLEAGSGSIINIASMSAQITNRPQVHVHYNAAKAGVVQMTRTLATEWTAQGVRVNSISPGHMKTPMTRFMDEAGKQTWISNTPAGRNGDPSDLQGAAVYLASDASCFVSGHDLIVDGGYTLW